MQVSKRIALRESFLRVKPIIMSRGVIALGGRFN